MSAFIEAQHPRDNGTFTDKEQSAPEVFFSPAEPVFSSHGRSYENLPELTAKIDQLNADDAELGPSDGRTTERNALFADLDQATGSFVATTRLLINAEYLERMDAPVLPLSAEFAVVRS